MAFPTVSVVDSFNRANGGLGTSWSNNPFNAGASAAAVSSNAYSANGNTYVEQWYNAASYANTAGIEVAVTLGTLPGKSAVGNLNGSWCGLIQQPSGSSSTADGYQFGAVRVTGTNTDRIHVYRYTNSTTATKVIDFALSRDWAANTDVIGLEIKPDGTVNAYVNGAVASTVNDTTYFHAGESAFGELALTGSGTATLDDFRVGQTVGSGTTDNAPQGDAVGQGIIPAATVAADPGAAVVSPTSPTANAPSGRGTTVVVGAGPSSTLVQTVGQGVATAQGIGPASKALGGTSAATATGLSPSAKATAPQGVGVGAGVAPSDGSATTDNAPRGNGAGIGVAPSSRMTSAQGVAVKVSLSPVGATSVAQRAVSTAGVSPARVTVAIPAGFALGSGAAPHAGGVVVDRVVWRTTRNATIASPGARGCSFGVSGVRAASFHVAGARTATFHTSGERD